MTAEGVLSFRPMKNVRLLLLSLTISTVSLSAADVAAANESAPTDRTRFSTGRMQSLIVAALDTDRNGSLSSTELGLAPTALRALDLNADGSLSSDELRRFETSRSTRSVRSATSFNVAFTLDANHDGEIQAMEIANATLSLKALDANGDGQVSSNELRPATIVAQAK